VFRSSVLVNPNLR